MALETKHGLLNSVMSYISLSISAIIGITLVSIFISFWVTELADQDAQAINLSGSMRMQTYAVGLSMERGDWQEAARLMEKLHTTWNHPLFSPQRVSGAEVDADTLAQHYQDAYVHWLNVLQPLLKRTLTEQVVPERLPVILDRQVDLTDALVSQFQKDAEVKIIRLRSFQLLVFLITVLVGSLIFYLLKNRIERPLSVLTDAAKRIGDGEFTQKVNIEGRDELALLASTFNQMGASIADSYAKLEDRVDLRTRELKQNNIALEFLFSTAKRILESSSDSLDYQQVIDQLSDVVACSHLELCLFTEQGDQPYAQLLPSSATHAHCGKASCNGCREIEDLHQVLNLPGEKRFPIAMEGRHYGIIDVKLNPNEHLPEWKTNLIQSVANQFAIALSLSEQKNHESRFAMLSERTVIARELHDSLAQALSYLQIQVTRLQKSHDKQKFDMQQPIIDELREGLSDAYRQLRELLTTFRLKVDEGGLRVALEQTVAQMQVRSDMKIVLDYRVDNIPFAPNEEIHLLQIVREALQNAVHHSQGTQVVVKLVAGNDGAIVLEIEDDGVGMPASPEKLNHYGLAIMSERSRQLDGLMDVSKGPLGGTCINFTFSPEVRQDSVRSS